MIKQPLFLFGDVVVVEKSLIGIVVKTWENQNGFHYEVYVRNFNRIVDYPENKVDRYRVRHKELNEEELCWQKGWG